MIKNDFYNSINNKCTFFQGTCNDDVDSIKENLQYAMRLKDKYLNKNVTCYYDETDLSNIYLNKELDLDYIIGISVSLSLFIF